MIHLCPTLEALVLPDQSWSPSESLASMEAMARASCAEIDWDDFAGENWGRLLVDATVVALVFMHRRFVFVVDEHVASIAAVATAPTIVVAVPSLAASVLTADRDQLRSVFGPGADSPALDTESFSADELWFCTV